MLNSKQTLEEFRNKLNVCLKDYFDEDKDVVSTSRSKLSVDYNHALSEFVLNGGKRLRPALFYYTYILLENHEDTDLVELSIFLEFIQAFLLIHDDVIDRSELRRGFPTTHVDYKNLAVEKNYPEPERYGEMIALLIGDIASQHINKIILQSNITDQQKVNLLKICASKIESVLVGQIEDFNLSIYEKFSEEDIQQVHQDKTVTYSFELPIESASTLVNNVSKETQYSLLRFAKHTGFAFQIRDDILGLFGDEEKTGKPSYTDLIEGKKTFLILDGLQLGSNEDKLVLQENLGNQSIGVKELEKVRSIIRKSGALEKSEQRCKEHIELAQRELENIRDEHNEGWQFLYGITDFIKNRTN